MNTPPPWKRNGGWLNIIEVDPKNWTGSEERVARGGTGGQAILTRDALYLFWSQAAGHSQWVDWEWQCALQERCIEFIDPIPLAPPEQVSPPKELADQLHFNDWVLAYMSTAKNAEHN